MPEWFIYTNETYYPYAEIVEATTGEEAIAARLCDASRAGALAFPIDAVAAIVNPSGEDLLKRLREEGEY